MLAGAIAFFIYASAVSRLMMSRKSPALSTTIALMPAWLASVAVLWFVWWRR